MAKTPKIKIPHNVKERLRHQNLQQLLENVASHVPQPPAVKRETKAKKLRRIVLYMKFLLKKRAQLSKEFSKVQKDSGVLKTKDKIEAVKGNVEIAKENPTVKSKPRHPEIVFLRKEKSPVTEINKESKYTGEREQDCNISQKTIHDGMLLTDEAASRDLSVHRQETSSSSDNYAAFQDLIYGTYPSPHSQTNCAALENPSSSCFKRPWEGDALHETEVYDSRLTKRNPCGIKKSSNWTEYLKDSALGTPRESAFAQANQNTSLGAPNPRTTLVDEENRYAAEMRAFSEKHNVFRSGQGDNLPPLSTFTPRQKLSPIYGDPRVYYPDTFHSNLCFGNNTNKSPATASLSQDRDNCPFDFFSSSESATITSSGELISSGEWFSSDEMDCGNFAEKASRSTPTLTVLAGGGDSVDSSDPSNKFGFDICRDPSETLCDMEQYMNFNKDNMPPNLYTHYGNPPPDGNVGLLNFSTNYIGYVPSRMAAGYGAIPHPLDDFFSLEQNTPPYRRAYQETRVRVDDANGKSAMKQTNVKVSRDKCAFDEQDEVVFEFPKSGTGNNRLGYLARRELKPDDVFGQQDSSVESSSESLTRQGDVFVPHNKCVPADVDEDAGFFGYSKVNATGVCGSQERQISEDFGHSNFKIGDECDGHAEMKIKQEEPEPSLLAEEISFSLNNLYSADWYGGNFINMQ